MEVVRGVISATEAESEELERFRFFRLSLRSAYDLVKTDCRSRIKQKRKDKPIKMHVPTICDWLSFFASVFDSDNHKWDVSEGIVRGIRTLFSLDHKWDVSEGIVSGIGTLFSLEHTLYASDYDPDPTPSLVKTSL